VLVPVEGYLTENAEITFEMFKDFEEEPFFSFVFSGTESNLLDGSISQAFLGNMPLSIAPLGTIDANPDSDGRRHFAFRIYFPYQYGRYFSVGFRSNKKDIDWEIARLGIKVQEDVSVNVNYIKNI